MFAPIINFCTIPGLSVLRRRCTDTGPPDQFTVRIEKHRLCNTTIGTFRSPVTQIAKFRRTVHPYPVRIGKRHFSNPVEHHGIPEIRRIRSFESPLYHQIQQQAIHSRPGIFFHQMHLLYSFVPTTDGFHFMILRINKRIAGRRQLSFPVVYGQIDNRRIDIIEYPLKTGCSPYRYRRPAGIIEDRQVAQPAIARRIVQGYNRYIPAEILVRHIPQKRVFQYPRNIFVGIRHSPISGLYAEIIPVHLSILFFHAFLP